MTKKNIRSIFLISLAGAAVWAVGFILILILNFDNTPVINKVWLMITFFGTLVVSVVKNMKDDKNER